jgi:RNA recognition motif. (a.k.a. RRM, RBD, or RNP domain)
LHGASHAWLSSASFPTCSRTISSSAASSSTARRAVFSQPKFRANSNSTSSGGAKAPTRRRRTLPAPSSDHPRSDGRVAQEHIRRIRSAGRVGTKRFVDPCRVFVGNLNFTETEASLARLVETTLGMPAGVCLHDVKVVTDWKTGQSKGYGFCVFTDPMYATLFIDKGHHQIWNGRKVTISQGAKKPADNQLFVKKKAKLAIAQSEEDQAILSAVQVAEDEDEQEDYIDDEELALLRLLDPDLVPGRTNTFESDDDETNSSMNRAQRRQVERGKKRTKPQSKGFG